MDPFTPMSSDRSTPGLDDMSLTVSPADTHLRQPSVTFADDVRDSDSPHSSEKKPNKKRKSWGQELPTPTTNLPPRKRAKTDAEKEQRRVERVLRNRNAAHASRERKRAEVELLQAEKDAIETQRDDLAKELEQKTHEIQLLRDQVAQLSAMVTGSNHSTPRSFMDAASPTLAPQLFKQESRDQLPLDQVPDQPSPLAQAAFPTPSTLNEPVATPSELTQHPAVSFGGEFTGISATDASFGYNFYNHPDPISDYDLNDLLLGDSAVGQDFDLIKIGSAHDGLPSGDANGFDIDDLVNIEAFGDPIDSSLDFSAPSTTQADSVHTGFGASSLGCDRLGIAAGSR